MLSCTFAAGDGATVEATEALADVSAAEKRAGAQTRGANRVRPERALSRSDGRALYDRYCADCHGPGGAGDGPAAPMIVGPEPTDFVDAASMLEATPAEFFQAVSLGVPGTAMPPWDDVLGEQERWDLIAFLWSLRPAAAELPDPGSCTACHASKGPAADFTVPGAIANRSDRALAENAAGAGEHANEDASGLTGLVQVARLFDLAVESASVRTFERRQIPRMLDLLVEEYGIGVVDGRVVDDLAYFEASSYERRVVEDIERVVGTGGTDSATVGELMRDLDAAVEGKAPAAHVAELAGRLKRAVALNLSE
jgi:mono/diheme cytochrome c family protein